MYLEQYNEIYDETGAKRPPYLAFEARLCRDVTQPPASLVKVLSQRGIIGTEGIYSVPLILDEANFREVILPGVLQRAFALQELFADIALGAGKIVSSGLLSEGDLDHILRSEGTSHRIVRRQWRGQARDQIRFVYGPDIVRDQCGRWVVLEDNVGCVGGVANGRIVLDTFFAEAAYSLHPGVDYRFDLEQAILAFLHRVGIAPHHKNLYGIPGIQMLNTSCSYDFETSYKAVALQSLGIIVTQPEDLLDEIAAGRAAPDAIINLSATLTSTYNRLAEAVFTDRDTPVFGAPSVGIIASKSFHSLGDALISLYMSEQSLLDIPPTQLLRVVPGTLPKDGVLKRTNGCQGTEVFFLNEANPNHNTLMEALKSWGPCGGVIQENVSHSMLTPTGGVVELTASVEIRPIVYVIGWRTAIVADVVTGRAILAGDRLGNISRGAQFLPVLREPVSSPE